MIGNDTFEDCMLMNEQPAWDSVVCMYAVYHLLRPAKGRTPTNSGSYHFFSLFMDTAIIPFYVFVVLLANQNYTEDVKTPDRWTSFFTNEQTTTMLIFVTYVSGIVLSALHFLSIGLDLYLVIMFRRIARLPPDMNPLEDNLTRRPSKKHKHKNSELSSTSSETLAEKKLGYYSGGSFVSDDWSRPGTKSVASARVIPFGHSRVDSNKTFSPHNPDTARLSRQNFDSLSLRPESTAGRNSRQEGSPTRQSRPRSLGPSKQGSFYENIDDEPAHPEHLDNFLAAGVLNHEHFVHPAMQKSGTPRQASPVQKGMLSDNWYVLDNESEVDMGSPQHQRGPSPAYSKIPVRERHDSCDPQPLGMNPPTPVNAPDGKNAPAEQGRHERQPAPRYETAQHLDVDRTMTMQSQASTIQASSIYSDDAPTIRVASKISPGTPKGKYYGDLAAATIGVRGGSPFMRASPGAPAYHTHQQANGSPRVVSRSGVDITDANAHYDSDQSYGIPRRREVSGKVAEEGRSAWNMRSR
jgi:hypothetical protein